jgi:hypothetical protein
LHPKNPGETLDKSHFQVINPYNEDFDHDDDLDLETPDGLSVVVVPP